MIASGGDTTWTDILSKGLKGRTVGISVHQYTIAGATWEDKGKDLGFKEDQWISTLANTLKMDQVRNDHLAILDKHDLKGAAGKVLTAAAMDAHNTFQDPQVIKPAAFSARAVGGKLPAKAVLVLALEE